MVNMIQQDDYIDDEWLMSLEEDIRNPGNIIMKVNVK